MYRIFGKRGTGKTKQLLEIASHTPDSVILTRNPERLKEKAATYGYIGLDIRGYETHKKLELEKSVFITDLEKFIQSLNNNQLVGYTISED